MHWQHENTCIAHIPKCTYTSNHLKHKITKNNNSANTNSILETKHLQKQLWSYSK